MTEIESDVLMLPLISFEFPWLSLDEYYEKIV
jgi:hypothetical protein